MYDRRITIDSRQVTKKIAEIVAREIALGNMGVLDMFRQEERDHIIKLVIKKLVHPKGKYKYEYWENANKNIK